MLVRGCVVKSVLLAQLSEEQAMIWHSVLSSHQLEVWATPESHNLIKLLTQKLQANQSLPELIIADISVRHESGTSLLATELCKWCTDNASQVKVLLINSRQTQIKEAEKRWAIRRGSINLLPKVSIHNISSSFVIATQALGIKVKPDILKATISALKLSQNQLNNGALQGKNIRQTATEDLARKMAMIPLMVMASEPDSKSSSNSWANSQGRLALDATISELKLYKVKIDLDEVGGTAQKLFQDNPLLPGLIVYEKEFFVGMLSRRKFLECLSRPYALELFLKRPLRVLYEQAETQILRLQGNISIVTASQKALSRASGDIYEPVVVHQDGEVYSVLDIHDLLQAQSHIHELATKLLREQTQTTMFQTEKMASLGQIVAEVSHDIRNPVSAIYGNTESLLTYIEGVMQILKAYEAEYGISSPVISKTLEQVDWDFVRSDLPQVVRSIQSGSEYLRLLVDTLQSLSNMEDQVNPEPMDLLECVDSSLT
ncbi:MAG: hypothetical protein ACKPCM_04360 [Pseudanabaena sp.]